MFFEMKGGVFGGHAGGVDPGEVGGLAGADGEGGAAGADEIDERIAVVPEVCDEFCAPGFAVAVGGLGSVVGKGVDFGERVAAGGGEAAAQRVVRDDGEGVAEAGDVPGFAGGEKGDGARGETLRKIEAGEMWGGGFVEDEVAVDFIGDEDEVVAFAEGGEFFDFGFRKHAAERVLRIAEEKQLGRGGDGLFHGFPIEGPDFIDEDVIDGDEFHLRIVVDAEEWRIDGRAGHHGLAGFAEGAGGEGKGGDESAEVDDVIERDGGVPAITEVGEDGVVETIVGLGVAEHAVVHAAVEGLDDGGSGGEVHIGHPERIEVGAAVELDAAGATAGDGGVEIGIHAAAFLGRNCGGFKRGAGGGWIFSGMIVKEFQSLQLRGGTGQSGGVPETMKNARRWSGFVCPDCRFVFRVPQDHDGRGIVCPSCRRMLKIPIVGDKPAPLVVPFESPQREGRQSGAKHGMEKRRRRKRRSRHADGNSWDHEPAMQTAAGGTEKRQMFWILAGGALVFAGIVVGVLMILNGGARQVAKVVPKPAAETAAAAPVETAQPGGQRTDAVFLTEAEVLAKRFLEATRVEDLLPLVRNPQKAEARIRSRYPDGKIAAPGMAAFNTLAEISRTGPGISLKIRTRDFEEKTLVFFELPEGLKIDWESWAGWSEMPWKTFLASKPVEGKVFRVLLSPIDYYNFGFSDDQKWQSYRLESPDGENAVYGYVERDSALNSQLRPPPDSKQVPLMLVLRFPENSASRDQVIIDQIVTEGWVLETETPP